MQCDTNQPYVSPGGVGHQIETTPKGTTPKCTTFQSVPDSPTGSDRSDITFDSSLGGSSIVSLSQLSVSEVPRLPSPSAHFTNRKVLDMLHPKNHRKKRTERCNVELDPLDGELAEDASYGGFSASQIKQTYDFLAMEAEDSSRGLCAEDFEAAFRKVKRARKQKSMEEEARKFMRTFRFLLQLSNKSPEQWFVETDTTPDCKLTWSEFETGMQKLCSDLGGAMFSRNGLLAMLRYMDPLCLGELTAPEVKAAFKRIKLPSKSGVILTEAGDVFTFMQTFVQHRAVRVQDLYGIFDVYRAKVISLKDFCVGIERLRGLMLSGGMVVQKNTQVSSRVDIKPFDPIVGHGGPLFPEHNTHEQVQLQRSNTKNHAPNREEPRRNRRNLKPLRGESSGHVAVEKEEKTVQKKPRIPPSPIRCPVVDSAALKERRRLLNGVSLRVPPPKKVNYQHIVQKGMNQYDPWIKHFDSTMKTGLILQAQS